MTEHEKKLAAVLNDAYCARVLNQQKSPHMTFASHARESHGFRAHAQAEHDRLVKMEKSLGCQLATRDFAASQHLAFLKEALKRCP